jgi:PAS domain S-box-containing protein
MIYIDIILQDDFLSKNETKKYSLLKISKLEERFNTYHSMFLSDISTIILVDGYLTIGKILYSSENFPFLFIYNVKELLGLNIDDLLPSNIQTFHKELIDNAIKYSNVNYLYKRQIDSLLKNKNGLLVNIKLFVKPSPNLSYGLTYFIYLQRDLECNKFIIVVDKDLKINGYSEINRTGDSFTMEEGYNLHQGLIGYHIGSIIPDILPLLEYNNDEFNIINDGLELKGYLYQVHKISEIKSKVDNILDKIKSRKRSNSNINQKKIEENILNISEEFNDLIDLLNKEKNKPFSIFYRIKMFSFLDGKYKYYRIYITNDNITENEKEENTQKKIEEMKSKKGNSMQIESSVSNINLNSNKNLHNIKKRKKKKILQAIIININQLVKKKKKKKKKD